MSRYVWPNPPLIDVPNLTPKILISAWRSPNDFKKKKMPHFIAMFKTEFALGDFVLILLLLLLLHTIPIFCLGPQLQFWFRLKLILRVLDRNIFSNRTSSLCLLGAFCWVSCRSLRRCSDWRSCLPVLSLNYQPGWIERFSLCTLYFFSSFQLFTHAFPVRQRLLVSLLWAGDYSSQSKNVLHPIHRNAIDCLLEFISAVELFVCCWAASAICLWRLDWLMAYWGWCWPSSTGIFEENKVLAAIEFLFLMRLDCADYPRLLFHFQTPKKTEF